LPLASGCAASAWRAKRLIRSASRKDLERHAPPEALVLSELDIGHAAVPEELEDALVAAMAVGREGAH